ncbi:MAG: cell division protein ZapA [Pseudomonadota bacterium]
MADVSVEVAGRAYRLACADGEEAHLQGLARGLDEKATGLLRQLRTAPEEGRLMLMLALLVADRLEETEAATTAAESARQAAETARAAADRRADREAEARAEAETLAEKLATQTPEVEELAAADERVSALEAALAAAEARAEAAEEALTAAEEAVESLTTTAKSQNPADLFASAGSREQTERIAALAARIEHLTDQIATHLPDP